MIGKFTLVDWVSLMSEIQRSCESAGSTESAITLTPRFWNSPLSLAVSPSSVVHTGVKSAGCENSTPQLWPSHSWKRMRPSEESCSKSGATSPKRRLAIDDLTCLSFPSLLYETSRHSKPICWPCICPRRHALRGGNPDGPARLSRKEETMSSQRKIRLGAFIMGPGHHVAAWRHPSGQADGAFNFEHLKGVTQTAERGLFDAVFLADGLATQFHPGAYGRTAYAGVFEPVTLFSALSAVTKHIGF